LKFNGDPKNHLLVGNPTAGRLRRLIVVQMEKFNGDPKKNVCIKTIKQKTSQRVGCSNGYCVSFLFELSFLLQHIGFKEVSEK
jgi:hypothetical protein